MPKQNIEINRRDAIKLLGTATGATVLANLPAKWSKPLLQSGVLPVHAQSSCIALTITEYDELENTSFGYGDWVGADEFSFGPDKFWYCRDECVYYLLETVSGGISMHGKTLNKEFDVIFSPANSPAGFMVDLATGDYVIYPDAPICGSWPLLRLKRI